MNRINNGIGRHYCKQELKLAAWWVVFLGAIVLGLCGAL